MKVDWKSGALFSFTISLMCCCAARATTLEKMSLARMSQAARVIVRARCIATSTAWDAGEIWTFNTFAITETWKASVVAPIPATIAVRLLGGTTGALASRVSGVPRFRPGEEVVLFLEPTSRGDFSVVGWEQGTFRIRRNPRTGQEAVTQDTAAFATFDPQTRRFEATGIRNVSRETFRNQVRSAIAHAGEKER
jgi:hypothetical protein